MVNDDIKGAARKVEGSIESGFGGLTNDRSAQFKGEAKKLAGDAQQAAGKAESKVLELAGRVRGFLDNASDEMSNATQRVNHEIHEKPVRSSIIAMGIGLVIGVLLAR